MKSTTPTAPTTACKRYGCHINPNPAHPNHGHCNRCLQEG
jgi:hypothetical protein